MIKCTSSLRRKRWRLGTGRAPSTHTLAEFARWDSSDELQRSVSGSSPRFPSLSKLSCSWEAESPLPLVQNPANRPDRNFCWQVETSAAAVGDVQACNLSSHVFFLHEDVEWWCGSGLLLAVCPVQDLKAVIKIQCPPGRKISSTGWDDNIIKIEAAVWFIIFLHGLRVVSAGLPETGGTGFLGWSFLCDSGRETITKNECRSLVKFSKRRVCWPSEWLSDLSTHSLNEHRCTHSLTL